MVAPTSLDSIPLRMAEPTQTIFRDLDRARYTQFLQLAFHQMRRRGAELRHAASILPQLEIKAALVMRARSEDFHFQLIESDLLALDAAPYPQAPKSVEAYRQYWNGIDGPRVLEWLGAWFAVASVTACMSDEILQSATTMGLSGDQSRFIRAHFAPNGEHLEGIRQACLEHIEDPGGSVITGATRAAALWIAMHRGLHQEEGEAA